MPGPDAAEPPSTDGPPRDAASPPSAPRRQPPAHLGHAYRVAFSETGALEVVLPATDQVHVPAPRTERPALAPAASPARPEPADHAGPAAWTNRAEHHRSLVTGLVVGVGLGLVLGVLLTALVGALVGVLPG